MTGRVGDKNVACYDVKAEVIRYLIEPVTFRILRIRRVAEVVAGPKAGCRLARQAPGRSLTVVS